jgi:endogenous inhibitor of DNA gyrase (YacG/DUF329 family)
MSADDPDDQTAAPKGRCPICGRAATLEYRPFCSRRCADVDLGRWLSGAYAIPTSGADDDEDGDQADDDIADRLPPPRSRTH